MAFGSNFFKDVVTKKEVGPSAIETIYYLFWEKGIDYNQFKELPIPYIMSILNTFNYVKKKEEEAMKK